MLIAKDAKCCLPKRTVRYGRGCPENKQIFDLHLFYSTPTSLRTLPVMRLPANWKVRGSSKWFQNIDFDYFGDWFQVSLWKSTIPE